jgi:cell division protein ZapA
MAQVTVTIDHKTYRMACNDGEEAHLEALAAHYDARIQEMRSNFGEIGDMRLAVMAAMTVADEVADAKRLLQEAEAALAQARSVIAGYEAERTAADGKLASTLTGMAERIERMSRALAPG